MEIDNLENKLVAVLGFGLEGQATTRYLLDHGEQPVLFDHRPWQEWPIDSQNYIKSLGLNFIFGEDCLKELAGFNLAFRSPGIPFLNPDLQKWIQKGLTVTSQTKWFFEQCPASIVGVTGTKGKGTTSALIYEILCAQSKILNLKSAIYLTGNIGKTQPFEILEELSKNDVVIYELSSFQLQDLHKSPHIGVVLMVTSEHLDHHTDTNEYRQAKESIVKFQSANDFAIVNADFEASVKIGELGLGKKLFFSRKDKVGEGCYVEGEKIVFVGTGFSPLNESGRVSTAPTLDLQSLQLRGHHNLENVCAAALASLCLGASMESIETTIKTFRGLEHRLELVVEKEGIQFYNDSFSTTPETAIAAVQAFTEPLVVILGGSEKKSDFSTLAKTLVGAHIRSIILIGPEAPRIKAELAQAGDFRGKIMEGATSMAVIFDQIKQVAMPGDVVLLSPACASFGMFKNYQDRGEQFKAFAKSFGN